MRSYTFDGPSTVITGPVAWLLERNYDLGKFREAAWEARDMEAYEQALGIKVCGLLWASRVLGQPTPATVTAAATDLGPADDDPMTTNEVATALGLGRANIAKAARKGHLRGFKQGKDWRFTREAVLEYVAIRRREEP